MAKSFNSKIYDAQECDLGSAGDTYQYEVDGRPSPDFVLCRDIDGNPTAVYGQDKWDFNPYRLSASKARNFRFDLLLKGEFKEERRALVDDAKYILFCIQYFAQAGHTGTVAVSTLYGYYNVISNAVKYCISLNSNPFTGIISLKELFSNKVYLAHFLTVKDGKSFKKRTRAICEHLVYIGEQKVGFRAVSDLQIEVEDSKQTPVIPTRIYLLLIANLTDDVEMLEGKLDRLPEFLSEFSDRAYGRAKRSQGAAGVSRFDRRPNMREALLAYELEDLFKDEIYVVDTSSLSAALRTIQCRMRWVLHLYTGMRDQEVMRLPYDCLEDEVITEEFKGEDGNTIVEGRTVKLVSTTTKFAGYRQSVSWYASPEAEKAINVLQKICEGLAAIHGVRPEECDLFLNPAVVQRPNTKIDVTNMTATVREPAWFQGLRITAKDLNELQASDPERDFTVEDGFQVGAVWPLRSHQFRRSLAFYAASSGFVKLPTLKRQFKHLTLAMTRYYSRNFENFVSIFGFYNEKTKEFELPSEHVIWECQSGVTVAVADMLINDLLGSSEKLYGGTGSYVERQRAKLRDGEIQIEEVREVTLKRVDKGEMHYKNTLLGGCTKTTNCDSSMLGEVTSCLTCAEGDIKESMIDVQIQELEEALPRFNESDGEHQVMSSELDKLLDYKQRRMTPKESEML